MRNYCKILAGILSLLMLVGCWHTKDEKRKKEARPFFEEALGYERSGETEKMKKALEETIDIYPAYVLAHLKYQKMLKDNMDAKEIVSYYEDLMKRYPDKPEFQFLYARLVPDLKEQEKLYKHAIEIDPQNPWGYYGLGWLYFQKRRYDDALEQYSQTVKLAPENVYFRNNLGGAYFYRGFYQKAINELKSCIEIDNTYALPYRNLASAYYKRGDFDAAISMLEKYIHLAPHADDIEKTKKQLKQLRGY